MKRLPFAAAAALLACGVAGSASGSSPKLDIFVVGVNGKGRVDLTAADPEPDTSPRLSPNGKTVAYVRGDGRIWLMNTDGSGQRPLFEEPQDTQAATDPIWSPSGRRIAYDVLRPLPIPDFSVAVRDVNTGSLVRTFSDARHPTWSPRGDSLAFEHGLSRFGDSADSLAVATLDGQEQSFGNGLSVLDPAWSPNGRLIAFYGANGEFNGPSLYVVRPDGTRTTRLAGGAPASGPVPRPAWSPDSKRIAFANDHAQLRLVTFDRFGHTRVRTLGSSNASPSWSPAGAKIAIFGVLGTLQIRSLKTGKARSLTPVQGGWYVDPPAWSRDGKRIYFTSLSQ